jgi:hypothetical protein
MNTMTIKRTRISICVLMVPMLLVTAVHSSMAAAPYKLDTAHAEGAGVMRCPAPRGGTQQVAIVFRDTYGVREKYTLSVAGKPLGEFEANLTDDDLIDGNRFWVWFSPAFSCQQGDKLEIAYSSDGKGVADILEMFFVKADQMDRLKMIISQESIVVRGRHLYTKLVSHYDHYTWQKVESNDAWVRVEAVAGCEFVKGFRKGHAEGGTRSLFVDFTAKVHAVKTWGYVEPISNRGTLTRPIVTMKCQFAGPRLFDGKEFWIATRGTTTHGGNQISPMFPMVAMDEASGAQKAEMERCLSARKEKPERDPRYGGDINWEAGKTIYVIAHLGMDHYARHRDGCLKDRPEIDQERTLTAYMIRVSDGTPEANKHRWPLYYWNSWLHRSDLQPLDEELTRRYAASADPKMWYFAVGNPDGLKKYLTAADLTWLHQQGNWGPNSYLTYQVIKGADERPRFVPNGHYLQRFPPRK